MSDTPTDEETCATGLEKIENYLMRASDNDYKAGRARELLNGKHDDYLTEAWRWRKEALEIVEGYEAKLSRLVADLDYAWGQFKDLKTELTAANEKVAALQDRVKELEAALRRLLKSSEREAIAAESMRVAAENFSDPNPEIDAYEKACIESSEAVKQANAALSTQENTNG